MQIDEPRPEAVIMIGDAGRKPRPLRLTTRDECRQLIRAAALAAAMLPDDGLEPVRDSLDCDAGWGSATPSQRCTLDDGHTGEHLDRDGYAWSEGVIPHRCTRSAVRGENPYPDLPEHRGEFGTYPSVDSRPWNCQGCGADMIGNPATYCHECGSLKTGGFPTPRELAAFPDTGVRTEPDVADGGTLTGCPAPRCVRLDGHHGPHRDNGARYFPAIIPDFEYGEDGQLAPCYLPLEHDETIPAGAVVHCDTGTHHAAALDEVLAAPEGSRP